MPTRTRAVRLISACAAISLLAPLTPANANPLNNVAALVGQVTDTQQRIGELELHLGELREEVNKKLVDLHDAQVSAEQARRAAEAARELLNNSQQELEAAQARLNELSQALYRNSGNRAVGALAGQDSAEAALDRATFLRQQSKQQQEIVNDLERARTEAANNESLARAAANLAESRAAAAEDAEEDARQTLSVNTTRMESAIADLNELLAARDSAQEELEQVRPATPTREENDTAQSNTAAPSREAAAPVETDASEPEATDESDSSGAETTSSTESTTSTTTSESVDSESTEEATQDAEPAELQVEAEPTQASQLPEDVVAELAESVAQSQPVHAETANPYEDSETPLAVYQGPVDGQETAAGEGSSDSEDVLGSSLSLLNALNELLAETEDADNIAVQDVVIEQEVLNSVVPEVKSAKAATVAVDASRSAKIETVIARAESQIGVPYAWGGGDANGPTRGIRDYGTADRHGDYNKVGFDCSGLVLYAFAGVGINLPHYTGYQYQRGTKIDPSEMERGDLIFYGPGGSNHVAIYLGDGIMLEAPQSGQFVHKTPVRWSGMSQYAVRLI